MVGPHRGAPRRDGAASTVELRVDEVRWDEVPTLFGTGARDRVYTLAQIESKTAAEAQRRKSDDDFYKGVKQAHQSSYAEMMSRAGGPHSILEGD